MKSVFLCKKKFPADLPARLVSQIDSEYFCEYQRDLRETGFNRRTLTTIDHLSIPYVSARSEYTKQNIPD